MFRALTSAERAAVIIASTALAAGAIVLCLMLAVSPTYPDFIVGSITWRAQTKLQDLLAAPVFLTTLFFGLWCLSWLVRETRTQFGTPSSEELTTQLVWWSIPSAIAIASLALASTLDRSLFLVSALGLVAVTAAAASGCRGGHYSSALTTGVGVFAILLITLLPLEIALLLSRAPTRWGGAIDIRRYAAPATILGTLAYVTVIALACLSPQRLHRWLPRLLLVGQLGLPLLFSTLYPANLVTPEGEITKYATRAWLVAPIFGLIVWGQIDVLRRYRKFRAFESSNWQGLISPIALFGLLVALDLGSTVPPKISPDDYHFGEHLLGWWSYLHGKVPYVGFVPAHGLVDDDLTGLISVLFYDGSASSIPEAGRFCHALLALIAYLSLYRATGSLGLAFVSTLLLGGRLAWLFLTPVFCLWLDKRLISKPSSWLSVWIITAPIAILGAPAQGFILIAASAPIVLWCAWNLLKDRKQRQWSAIGISAGTLLVSALLTPLPSMLLGAARYVLENAPINQTAYGIPWDVSWTASAPAGLLFELVRMSWMAIPLVALSMIAASAKKQPEGIVALLPVAAVLMFSFLLIPYSMGRIDPSRVSRAGFAALFSWTVLLPLLARPFLDANKKAVTVLLIALIGASLNLQSVSFSSLFSEDLSKVATGLLRDSRGAGLPNIGRGSVQDDQWDRLVNLQALLSKRLSPNDTYLDLTGRSAHYFYMNRLPPVEITAPYNMAPLPQQRRAVAALSRLPPRLALLESSNIANDGGGLSLRDPVLYRFVLDNYFPAWERGFVVGYPQRDRRRIEQQPIEVPVKNFTDSNWDRGVNRGEAAILFNDPVLLRGLSPGSEVVLANGERRRISRIWVDGSAVWVDGPPLNPSSVGAPHMIRTTLDPRLASEFQLVLLDKAFAVPDIAKIPVSWGRSEHSLSDRMALINKFDSISPSVHDLALEDGNYRVVGPSPQMTFDISSLAISGRDAGLLRFEFSCIDKKSEPRLHVFWWGDGQINATEAASLRFTADDGPLIVPLDAYPRWVSLQRVRGIRIDLDSANACGATSVTHVSLNQRRALLD